MIRNQFLFFPSATKSTNATSLISLKILSTTSSSPLKNFRNNNGFIRKFSTMTGFYDLQSSDINKKPFSFAEWKGKVVLLVNVASKCGFTPQYSGLESLYNKYKDEGLVIAGFPCNQFGSQEPGTEGEIVQFCSTKYNVTFPLFAKIDVNGANASSVYEYLKSQQSGDIKWNFEKFLIDKNGNVVKRFPSNVKPEDLEKEVNPLLKSNL
ncbi:19861_t:CDS:2 [Funneliformis geosporum]|uniref:Glutathione peroxidase n=1 Tax=Funneliformis geosporum TaxID=1117311 RepID=A0A9W4SIZ1_9GLOM|nr:19861_t:CDS:2 [Funneliformis geosporum]